MGIHRESRDSEKVVFITFFDERGEVVAKEWLPPRKIYRTTDGRDYVHVTRNNREIRCHVQEGEVLGTPCYVGAVDVKAGTRRSSKFKTSIAIEKDQIEAIKRMAKKDRITYAEAVRQIIEWGLETTEGYYEAK